MADLLISLANSTVERILERMDPEASPPRTTVASAATCFLPPLSQTTADSATSMPRRLEAIKQATRTSFLTWEEVAQNPIHRLEGLAMSQRREAMENVAGTFGRMMAYPVEDSKYQHLVVYSPRSDYWSMVCGLLRIEVAPGRAPLPLARDRVGAGVPSSTEPPAQAERSVAGALILWLYTKGQAIAEV
ncbi:hypothetical protein FA13DRAFT_1722822 [Coprinellus micaceus]|uniref:Uncharacterized protein n=1 Tax=Coprinellus micaceus TaxID=71717 RepID=A0A4Y7RI59_COPMI|nr:hypothetical protein FA13DRAFT_1722822 [Coprinellus micaceus]